MARVSEMAGFDEDIPQLQQLQKLVALTLPPIAACVVMRGVVVLFLKALAVTGRRFSRRFVDFLHVCNRIDRAGQVAGKTTCFICILIASAGMLEIWDEATDCKYAITPRPHAMFLTCTIIGVAATAAMGPNALNLAALVVFSRRNPSAYMLTIAGFLEWLSPRGAVVEISMMAVYGTMAWLSTIHFNECGAKHSASDSLLVSVGWLGSSSWLATTTARSILEKRWSRAAN